MKEVYDMELSIQRPTPVEPNVNTSYTTSASNSLPEEVALERPISTNKSEAGNNYNHGEEQSQKQELTKDETLELTRLLNEYMRRNNANLQFEIHEKTDRLMVKFVDRTDQRVIKEFPPRELLDTLAAIQEYVGVLLDKKV